MEDYKQVPYDGALAACGFCGSDAHMWQHMNKAEVVRLVVMCSLDAGDSPLGDDCPLFMPPEEFYMATKREAAQHWNRWAEVRASKSPPATDRAPSPPQ